MKKMFLAVVAILMLAISAFAGGDLARTNSSLQFGGTPIQFFAPEVTTALSVNSSTVDMSSYILYAVNPLSVATCYMRLMPASNSTKANYPQAQIPVSTWTIRAVNPAVKFVNFSGCTGGYLQKQ